MTRAGIGQPHLFEPPTPITLTLRDRFLVPPFSVLDARAGYWQQRKRDWLRLGIRSELGRGEMLGIQTGGHDWDEYRKNARSREVASLQADGLLMRDAYAASNVTGAADLPDWANNGTAQIAPGTSIFDPVLCELLIRWFSPTDGHVIDPFAGGSVRGIVAGVLGRSYTGIDLRPEQVASNEEQARELADRLVVTPSWIAGDGRDVQTLTGSQPCDFILSCPPYYDLEVYSDDPRDLSMAGSYDEFRDALGVIVAEACSLLADDRFACFVVGEVRGKDGAYIGLVPDTIRAFEAAGLRLYNEAVLLTQVGTLALRVSRAFGVGRKMGKSHQNVLVFLKGDWRRACAACEMPDEVAVEYGGATWTADGAVEMTDTGERAAGYDPEIGF